MKMFQSMRSLIVAVCAVVAAIGVQSQSANAQAAVQWTVASGGNGHWYGLTSTVGNWDLGQQLAHQVHGEMVSITSQAENDFLKSAFYANTGFYWIGARRTSGSWSWISGEAWSFTAWAPGEPNGGDGQFAWMYSSLGLWNDHTQNSGEVGRSIIEWSADCNNDGIVDYGQILAGQMLDVNTNGIPDCCENSTVCLDADADGIPDGQDNCPTTPNPDQLDCDSNGVGNACQSGNADCNANGIPDYCDIASGTSTDADLNGVPDSCQPDCNLNNLPDAWEIVTGLVTDLNIDGIPDTCQGALMIDSTTENLGSPSGLDVRSHSFTALPYAESAVTLTLDAIGDLNNLSEWIDVRLNDGAARRFFASDGQLCPATPDRAVITLTREEFNAIIGTSSTLSVTLTCSATVEGTECKGSGLTQLRLQYVGIDPATGDCNNNQRLDIVETYEGTTPDCNANQVPDSCDIARGAAGDCNTNGVPDSCEIASTPALDCNGNGIIDSCDLATGGTTIDCDSNGRIDSCQVVENPSQDCNSNGIPDTCDIAAGTSADRDANATPDECQTVQVPGEYATIQAAIDAAPVKVMRIINVAAGTYAGPIAFNGKPVVVHGAGAGLTLLNGASGQTLSVVRFTGGEPAIAALERVTVKGGLTGSPLPLSPQILVGGGIFSYNSGASVRDCVIEQNISSFGAGAYIWNSTGTIERCTFRLNNAATDGGGIQLYRGSPTVIDTIVENNFTNSRGGGIHAVEGTPRLVQTTVRNNTSANIVGGLSWVPAGAATAFLQLENCTVTGNSALIIQGGIGVVDDAGTTKMSFQATTVCNNLPRPNVAGRYQDLGGNTICDCAGDLMLDGVVNGADLAIMLGGWGNCTGSCPADFDGNGVVNGADLAVLLGMWGSCGG